MAVWVLAGNEENWRHTFQNGNVWGVKPSRERLWKRLGIGDRAYFYCKAPVKSVVGLGTIREKFTGEDFFWPDEKRDGRVIYPFRFRFEVDFLLPPVHWETQGAKASEIPLKRNHYSSGLNPLKERSLPERINQLLAVPRQKEFRDRELSHKGVQEMLHEIGRFQRFISELEYPMEDERVDVVWRKVERGVPAFVFEVQVRGDVMHALGKLKHAHDLWNSNLVLAVSDRDLPKASTLLSGTFHEIGRRVKVLKLEDVRRLYELKKAWKDFEVQLGIAEPEPLVA